MSDQDGGNYIGQQEEPRCKRCKGQFIKAGEPKTCSWESGFFHEVCLPTPGGMSERGCTCKETGGAECSIHASTPHTQKTVGEVKESCPDCKVGFMKMWLCPAHASKTVGEPRCKSSPLCSHNTNGRDLDKPCSISAPTTEEGWQAELAECFRDLEEKYPTVIYGVQQLFRKVAADSYKRGREDANDETEWVKALNKSDYVKGRAEGAIAAQKKVAEWIKGQRGYLTPEEAGLCRQILELLSTKDTPQ